MKKITVPLVLSMLSGLLFSSCSQTASPADDSSDPSGQTTAPDNVGYLYYEGNDLGGTEISILNVAKICANMLCMINPDEINGETINDAMYERNAFVMEKLNFTIAEDNRTTTAETMKVFEQAMLAQDDSYDIAYVPMNQSYKALTAGYFQNLRNIDSLHLSESWWDQTFLSATELNGHNYFASSPLHLMAVEGIWCLFFNHDMMDNLSLDYPYDLVREGKWTLDKLAEYCKSAANLNGEDTFALTADSSTVYGSTSFYNSINKFILGMGGSFIEKENDGLVFSCRNESFIDICGRLANFFKNKGYFVLSDDDSKPATSYTTLFMKNRSLFLGAEVKMSSTLRDKKETFGIVPFPKMDDTQDSYRSTALQQVAVMTVPITNQNPEAAALAMDALSYESMEKVLPLYYEVRVEQKGLRNDDSIEMLEIIRNSCTYDIGILYGWVDTLEAAIRNQLVDGNPLVMSTIDSHRSAIEANIANMMDFIQQLD